MATEQGIKEAIRHIANNWRRKDQLFYSHSFPVYQQAFKDVDDEILEAAIIKFISTYTNTFNPPFGVIKEFVMKEIGIKENKNGLQHLIVQIVTVAKDTHPFFGKLQPEDIK